MHPNSSTTFAKSPSYPRLTPPATQQCSNPTPHYTKWTRQENILYVRFLKANIQRMNKTHFKKPYNKFKKMAQYLTSKDSFQCRSHHQKMIKKYLTLESIIHNLSHLLIKNQPTHNPLSNHSGLNQIKLQTDKSSKSTLVQKQCKNQISQIKIQQLHVQIKPLCYSINQTEKTDNAGEQYTCKSVKSGKKLNKIDTKKQTRANEDNGCSLKFKNQKGYKEQESELVDKNEEEMRKQAKKQKKQGEERIIEILADNNGFLCSSNRSWAIEYSSQCQQYYFQQNMRQWPLMMMPVWTFYEQRVDEGCVNNNYYQKQN